MMLNFYRRVRDAILTRLWRVQGSVYLRLLGVKAGEKLRFYGMPIVALFPGSSLTIGARTVFCSHARFTALGVSRPVIIRTLSADATIVIGSDVGMSGTVICCAKGISIGNGCLFGADVQITDTDFHSIAPENRRYNNDVKSIRSSRVNIGDNVFLGAGVRVLKGVSVGRNSVVGAGSVVTSSIPENVVAAGCPARVISAVS